MWDEISMPTFWANLQASFRSKHIAIDINAVNFLLAFDIYFVSEKKLF